jgi:hypothetical protein
MRQQNIPMRKVTRHRQLAINVTILIATAFGGAWPLFYVSFCTVRNIHQSQTLLDLFLFRDGIMPLAVIGIGVVALVSWFAGAWCGASEAALDERRNVFVGCLIAIWFMFSYIA